MENGYSLCLNKWALDKDIKNELGLLVIISSLCAEKGYCWASNEYFGELFNIPPKTISRKIKLLEDKNYIEVEYERKGTQVTKRYIRIPNLWNDHHPQKCGWTIPKNEEENNISINNINNIIKEFENEIGNMTPYQLDRLQSYTDDLSEEMIIEAIHIASRYNKKSLSYIEAILKQWIANNVKCKADIKPVRLTKNTAKRMQLEMSQSYIDQINDLYEN